MLSSECSYLPRTSNSRTDCRFCRWDARHDLRTTTSRSTFTTFRGRWSTRRRRARFWRSPSWEPARMAVPLALPSSPGRCAPGDGSRLKASSIRVAATPALGREADPGQVDDCQAAARKADDEGKPAACCKTLELVRVQRTASTGNSHSLLSSNSVRPHCAGHDQLRNLACDPVSS